MPNKLLQIQLNRTILKNVEKFIKKKYLRYQIDIHGFMYRDLGNCKSGI